MVEMKGNWLKLPGYREVNVLVHEKQGSFIKRMFLDALSLNRSYQSWENSGKDNKGCWPSAILYFRWEDDGKRSSQLSWLKDQMPSKAGEESK